MSSPLPAHDPRQVDDPDGWMVASWEHGLRWRTLPAAMGRALRFTFRAAPRTAALAMALALLSAVIYASLYGMLGRLLGGVEQLGSVAAVLGSPGVPLVLAGGVLLGVLAVCGAGRQYVDWRLHNEVLGHTDMATLRAAARVPLEHYEDDAFFALLQRCSNSVGQVCAAAPSIVRFLGDAVAALAIALTLSVTNRWLLPVAVAAALPALVTELWSARQWYRVQVRIAWPARLRYYLDTVVRGRPAAAEIRALGLGETFESWSQAAFRSMARPQRAAARSRSAWSLLASALSGLILVAGAALSLGPSGGGLAGLVTAVVGLTQLRAIFGGMFQTLSEVADAALYLRDIEELGKTDQGPASRSIVESVSAASASLVEVTMDRVGYRYPGCDRPAIADISLSLRAGELIAVVGRNGSGKTTLAHVLAGLLPATEGAIQWNGVPYGQPRLAVRPGVTMQFQDPTRWCFTVRENVCLGDTAGAGADRRIWSALERAQLAELVRGLPDGLDTRLGKELGPGSDLSGGQWQRLALARCFYRDSQLVILDEPTSAFDAIAEASFLGSIRELLAGRAGLLITHRLAHLTLADQIYVLDGGRVVQRGTHDELVAQDGSYAELYRTQLENQVGSGTPLT